jgi:fucose 4-O-acetylase-like acetyltransferase
LCQQEAFQSGSGNENENTDESTFWKRGRRLLSSLFRQSGAAKNGLARNCYLDNAKGILIFLVVFGHVIQGLLESFHGRDLESFSFASVYSGIYLFHMPAFVFIAGYFDKGIPDLKLVLRTLLIPYLILQIAFTSTMQPGAFVLQMATPCYGLWFLLAMVHWRILLLMFSQVKHALFIAFFIGLFAGCVSDIGMSLALSRALYFFPFYLLGHLVCQKRVTIPPVFFTPRGKVGIVLGAMLLLFALGIGVLALRIQAARAVDFLLVFSPYSAIGVGNAAGILGRCLLYFAALVVGGAFFAIVPKSKSFLTQLGQNSFAIFIWHFYAFECIRRHANWLYDFTESWRWVFVAVCSIGITWFFSLPVFQNLLSWTRNLPLPAPQAPAPSLRRRP